MSLFLVAEGDSQTIADGGALSIQYPEQMALLYTDNRMISVTNVAISGTTLQQMIDRSANVEAEYDTRKAPNIVLLWGGTNDMARGVNSDFSGSGAYARLVSYVQSRQANGWKVVGIKCLPRQDVGTPAGYETQRAIFNGSDWTICNAVADIAADVRLQDPTNTTYFNADTVHLTAAGYAIVAALVKVAIDSLL